MAPSLHAMATLATILFGLGGPPHDPLQQLVNQAITIRDVVPSGDAAIEDMAFSGDDRCLYVAAGNQIRSISLDGAGPQKLLHRHSCAIKSISISADGKCVTGWDVNSIFFQVDIRGQRQVKEWGEKDEMWYLGKAKIGDGGHSIICWNGGVWRCNGKIVLVDFGRETRERSFESPCSEVSTVASSAKAALIAVAGDDWLVKGAMNLSFSRAGSPVRVKRENRIFLIETTAFSLRKILYDDLPEVSAMAFSPEGDFLLSAHENGTVVLWKTSNGMVHRRLKTGRKVARVAWSHDKKTIAFSDSKTVWLREVKSGNGKRDAGNGKPDAARLGPSLPMYPGRLE